MKNATFSGEKESRSYFDLNHGANTLLSVSESFQKGSFYTILSSIVLRSFAFEAYLNHLGERIFELWDHEDHIKISDKYSKICDHLNLSTDFSRRPEQTITGLFKFRNDIAHAGSEVIERTKKYDPVSDKFGYIPKADWQEYCSEKNALRAKEDIEAIISGLHKSAGLGDYPFMDSVGSGSITTKKLAQPVDRHQSI